MRRPSGGSRTCSKKYPTSKWTDHCSAFETARDTSPRYREEFGANLRANLPRIPLAETFSMYCQAGRSLAALHLHYEESVPYPLRAIEADGKQLSFAVSEKMKLSSGGSQIKVNESLILDGIPESAHRYKLGNRSAIEWIISQYHSADNDPNRESDEEYIVRLIGQVVQVSIDTVAITEKLDQ